MRASPKRAKLASSDARYRCDRTLPGMTNATAEYILDWVDADDAPRLADPS